MFKTYLWKISVFQLLLIINCVCNANLSQPALADFDSAMHEIWNKQHATTELNSKGEVYNPPCIPLPKAPPSAMESKTKTAPLYYIDFIVNQSRSDEYDIQLKKFDALANAGLLNKSNEIVSIEQKPKSVVRYKISDKGWAADKDSRSHVCFIYGKTIYRKVTSFEPKVFPGHENIELFTVHANIGLDTITDIPEWAKRDDIQNEFPAIKDNIVGKDFSVVLIKEGGKWINADVFVMREMFKNSPEAIKQIDDNIKLSVEKEENIRKNEPKADGNLPPPTENEIKLLLENSYHISDVGSGPSDCVDLPGASAFPVDRNLSTSRPTQYAVELFKNESRDNRNPIVSKTIPYINYLELMGVLHKKINPQLKKDAGENATSLIYELTPAYADKIHANYPECLPLGNPSMQIIDLKIKDRYTDSFLLSSFRYKIRLVYKNPPKWAKNDTLLKSWNELKGMLTYGRVCEGDFAFDRKTRSLMHGGGTCIKGFDSIAN